MRTVLVQAPSIALSLALLGLLTGCEGDKAKEPAPQPSAAAPAASAPSKAVNPYGSNPHAKGAHGAPPANAAPMQKPSLGIEWEVPSDFDEVPTRSMMRHATYNAKGEAGAAEIAVFYFGAGQGGEIEANISRWVGQFKDKAADAVTRDAREANGLKHTIVSVKSGTFASGMPGGAKGPQENWGLEGAIIEAPSGRYFFKMTGPAATVEKNRAAFAKMLTSAKVKK